MMKWIKQHPILYPTVLVICAMLFVALILVGLDSASAQTQDVVHWGQHVYSAETISGWDGDVVNITFDRPHNYTVTNTTTSLQITMSFVIDSGTGAPQSRQFHIDLNSTRLSFCTVYARADGSGTVALQGIDTILGGIRCPTTNNGDELLDLDSINSFTFDNSGSAGVTFLSMNVYLLVQDTVTIPTATDGSDPDTMTLLEDVTGIDPLSFLTLIGIVLAGMVIWSRAQDDGVRIFAAFLTMTPGFAMLTMLPTSTGDWAFLPFIAAASILAGTYLLLRQGFDRMSDGRFGN